ncbi:hypothetical protein ACOMHN_014477 [Nucella lapillus]
MRRGRAGRQRRQHRMRRAQQNAVKRDGSWGELRKWMVSNSSRADVASTLGLVPFCFPDTGRGLKTKASIQPGAVIVSIPQPLLVMVSTVLNSPLLGPLLTRWKSSFTPQQLLSLFLLVERNKGSHSRWHPFVTSLPSDYTLPHYFSSDELNALPTHVSLAAQRMIQRSRLAHRQLAKFCAAHWKDSTVWSSWERFRWAWCTVSSRAVFVETDVGMEGLDVSVRAENNVALCPYLDLLNHSSTARVQAGLNRNSQRYEIITEDTYEPHDQVFISYGPHDNTTLFLHYGFTLPCNVHNSVSICVDDFKQLQQMFKVTCWDLKQDALRKHDLLRGLSCTLEGASWNLMCALKILSMNWDQLQRSERALTGEELSPAVELSAQRMAQHLVCQTLARAQAHFAKLPQTETLSSHLSIAHRLLTDEINILIVTLRGLT